MAARPADKTTGRENPTMGRGCRERLAGLDDVIPLTKNPLLDFLGQRRETMHARDGLARQRVLHHADGVGWRGLPSVWAGLHGSE